MTAFHRRHAALAGALLPLAWFALAGAPRAETPQEYCERQPEGIIREVCLRELNKSRTERPKAPAAAAASGGSATGAAASAAGAAPATAPAGTSPAGAAAASGDKPYRVVDGFHVDPQTFKGFQTWRAAACDRCHGANQEGMVGPSLINSLKTLSKEDFVKTVTNGRLEKGMPSFAQNQTVMNGLDSLYAYLKGRSDGAITKAHVQPMQP